VFNLNVDEIRTIITQLDQAIYNHEQWHKHIMRTLVSRLPHEPHDVAPDAHTHCRFGQWYYGTAHPKLRELPAFESIEAEHRQIHSLVAGMLLSAENGSPIPPPDYDAFSNSIERLRLQIQTLKREMEETLYRRDPLTGVNSRITLLTHLREQQEMVKRDIHQSCIVMADLDNFKRINDTFGHHIGDSVLIAVANYMIANIRPYDKIFRYGGEEFLFSMPNATAEDGFAVMERLRTGIAEMPLAIEGIAPVHITLSVGIALIEKEGRVEDAIDCADKAMYSAKGGGRNRTCIWEGPWNSGRIVCPAK
jgi:diguanylate cyclase (GGDEF)-like protein